MGGGEGRERDLVVLVASVAPERERRMLPFAVRLDPLLELLARVDVSAVDADDPADTAGLSASTSATTTPFVVPKCWASSGVRSWTTSPSQGRRTSP